MVDLPSFSASDAASVQTYLAANGYSAPDVQAAVQAYTGMTDGEMTQAGQALEGMAAGQDPIKAAGPLLGTAMLASGVAAPVAAAVAAGLMLFDGLASTLGPKNDCSDGYSIGGDATWKSGAFGLGSGGTSSICIHTKRPREPGDPYWSRLDDQIADWRAHNFDWIDPINAGVDTGPTGANVGMYRQVVEIELPAIAAMEQLGPLPPEVQFEKLFCLAWKANAERAINGHPSAKLTHLLNALVGAWNARHSDSTIVTIEPSDGGFVTSEHDPDVRTHDSVVSILIAGNLDPDDYAEVGGPLAINAGPLPADAVARTYAAGAFALAKKPIDLGATFFKFASKGKQMASLGTLVEVQPSPAKPRTIALHLGHMTPAQSKALVSYLEQAKAPAKADGFTVFGKHITKKQATVGGVVAGGLLALKLIF